MRNSALILYGVINSVAAFAYIAFVAWILFNGQRLFGTVNDFSGPLAMLLLFVVSAAIVGGLVLGRPVYLYLEGFKREAVKLFLYTVGWLALITIVVFAVKMFW